MFVKSLQKQLQSIFSEAAYKSTGLLLKCRSTAVLQQPLAFKIDIAQKLYHHYKLAEFKFCEKGTTPRSIAQEVAIFVHQNPHFTLDIDSFGFIQVSPSLQYYKQMKERLLGSSEICHYPIVKPQGLPTTSESQNEYILYRVQDLSLSSLRLVNQLELHSKKQILLRENSKSTVFKIIDLSKLSGPQIQLFLSAQLVDFDNFAAEFILPPSISKIKLANQFRQGCNLQNIKERMSKKGENVVFSGCLRHKYVQLLKDYRGLIEENDDRIVKIGEIFPKILLQQLKFSYPDSFQQELRRILQYSAKIENILPINLNEPPHQPPLFPFTAINPLFQNRNSNQTILLLLECISNDRVVQSYEFLKQLKKKRHFESEWPVYQLLLRKLQTILI